MTTLFNNIQEYKEKYADELAKPQNKDLTDQKIADFVYEKYNSFRPEYDQLDYFSFMQEFYPEGDYNNVDTYRQKFNIPNELTNLEDEYKEFAIGISIFVSCTTNFVKPFLNLIIA